VDCRAFVAVGRTLATGKRFRTLAQPIVRLAGRRRIGYKLLNRSTVPGFERPDDFLAVSQDAGVLAEADLACFCRALAAATALDPALRRHVPLCPATILATPADEILAALGPDLAPEEVWIEVSARRLTEHPRDLAGPLAALQDYGLHLALTNVGFGQSSLESLLVLEPDLVKVSRTRVRDVGRDAGQRRTLTRLVNMARALGVEVMAGTVERQEDLDVLLDLDVRLGQGNLFGEPRGVAEYGLPGRVCPPEDDVPSPSVIATAEEAPPSPP